MEVVKILETERLYLREITPDDAQSAFDLNIDPDVIKYTGDDAFESVEEARHFLEQYDHFRKYGFGRWGVIDKTTHEFLGWCGLKYTPELDEFDIGFRFFKKHWNKGYASEAAKACLALGFEKFKMQTIVGRVMKENKASRRVLEKIGLKYSEDRSCGGEEGLLYKIEKQKEEMIKTFKYSLEGEETERIRFRKVEATDFDIWLGFCEFPDSVKYIFSQEQLKEEDPVVRCRMWFDRVFNRYEKGTGGMNALIDKATGAYLGQCGLLIQNIDGLEELEVGYSLMPEHRGKGYALEAAMKCRDFAFENGFRDSLISTIHIENEASMKVARANGMQLDKTTVSNGDPVHIFRIRKEVGAGDR